MGRELSADGRVSKATSFPPYPGVFVSSTFTGPTRNQGGLMLVICPISAAPIVPGTSAASGQQDQPCRTGKRPSPIGHADPLAEPLHN